MNLHTVRSGGFAGIAFIVVVIISFFIPGVPPENSAPIADITKYFDAHRVAFLVGAWLSIPAVALYLWYAVGLYRRLLAAGVDEGLPIFSLINGVIASATSMVTAFIQIALVFHPSSETGTQVFRALYDAYSVTAAFTFGVTAFWIFGAALSGQRHRSLPGWLCGLGYVFALANLAASLTAMYNSGFMALGGFGGLIFGLLAFLVWVLLSAIVMLGKGAEAPKR